VTQTVPVADRIDCRVGVYHGCRLEGLEYDSDLLTPLRHRDEVESLMQMTLTLLNENHPITSAENYKHASHVSVVYWSSSSAERTNATTTTWPPPRSINKAKKEERYVQGMCAFYF
jgi:hypothetical protein